jgi:mono/diheme cytochrome c family protein
MSSPRPSAIAAITLAIAGFSAAFALSPAAAADKASIERGRYLAKVAGCNDCHTPGYAMSGGNVPESQWLVGDHVGWKGAWGTTYPANLRLALARYSEDEWVKLARNAQYRPPMPWFALRDMSEADLRAFHRYVRSLGAAGEPAPAYLPPGEMPKGPAWTSPELPAPPQKAAAR